MLMLARPLLRRRVAAALVRRPPPHAGVWGTGAQQQWRVWEPGFPHMLCRGMRGGAAGGGGRQRGRRHRRTDGRQMEVETETGMGMEVETEEALRVRSLKERAYACARANEFVAFRALLDEHSGALLRDVPPAVLHSALQFFRYSGNPGPSVALVQRLVEGEVLVQKGLLHKECKAVLGIFASADAVEKSVRDGRGGEEEEEDAHLRKLLRSMSKKTSRILMSGFAQRGYMDVAERIMTIKEGGDAARSPTPLAVLLQGYARAHDIAGIQSVARRKERGGHVFDTHTWRYAMYQCTNSLRTAPRRSSAHTRTRVRDRPSTRDAEAEEAEADVLQPQRESARATLTAILQSMPKDERMLLYRDAQLRVACIKSFMLTQAPDSRARRGGRQRPTLNMSIAAVLGQLLPDDYVQVDPLSPVPIAPPPSSSPPSPSSLSSSSPSFTAAGHIRTPTTLDGAIEESRIRASALMAHARGGDWPAVDDLYSDMPAFCWTFPEAVSSVLATDLHQCGMAGISQRAERVFAELARIGDLGLKGESRPSSQDWANLMNAYASSGDQPGALAVLHRMATQHVPITMDVWNIVLRAVNNDRDANGVIRISRWLERQPELELDTAALRTTLRAFATKSSARGAEEAFISLLKSGVPLQVHDWHSLLSALAKRGKPRQVLRWLRKMRAANADITPVTYTYLMRAYATSGDVDGCERLLHQLTHDQVPDVTGAPPPIAATWIALLEAYARAGQWDAIADVIDRAQPLLPARRAWNWVLQLAIDGQNWTEIRRVLQQMESAAVSVSSSNQRQLAGNVNAAAFGARMRLSESVVQLIDSSTNTRARDLRAPAR